MRKSRNTIDGVVGIIEILITRVTKALVPQHAASSILNGKDREFQERSVVLSVKGIVAGIAVVDVTVSVDVYVAVFIVCIFEMMTSMQERRCSWCQCLDDG